jgi:hypothetical protein
MVEEIVTLVLPFHSRRALTPQFEPYGLEEPANWYRFPYSDAEARNFD